MDSQIRANLAEWVLRRVVDPARASELVGDQLETQPGLGDVRFWLSIGWLVIVFSWRTVAGVLAASIAGTLLSWIPFAWALTRLWSIELRPAGPPPDGGPYIAISMLLWNAAIFFLIRFGMRSALTWIGLSWALLSTFAVCTFWIQNVNLSILVGTGALLLLFFRNPQNRRPLIVLFSTLACGGLTMYTLFKIPINPRALPPSASLAIVLLQLMLTVVAECSAASFLHKRLLISQNPASSKSPI